MIYDILFNTCYCYIRAIYALMVLAVGMKLIDEKLDMFSLVQTYITNGPHIANIHTAHIYWAFKAHFIVQD